MSYQSQNVHRARLPTALERDSVALAICQQPLQALVTNEHKEKTRKAIDPPPIVQLKVDESRIHDQRRNWLVSPFIFMNVVLVHRDTDPTTGSYPAVPGNNILGQTVSSLHRLKDSNNTDGGFFVFGDISCRKLGTYRLQFNLFDFDNSEVIFVATKVSEPFQVVMSKDFHGQRESTQLSRKFSEQGVRLRLRKEQRSIAGRKRSFEGSPPQSSVTPLAPNLLPASQSERAYAYHPGKRQRSDEYPAPMFVQQQQQHVPANTLYQYGTSIAGNGYGVAGQGGQNSHFEGRYSNQIGQSYSLSDASPNWQRPVAQAQQAAPGEAYGSNTYLQGIPSTASLVRNHTAPSRSSQQGHITPIGTTDDSLSALGGLHTPSSLPDTTRTASSSRQPSYVPVAQDASAHNPGYSTAQSSYSMQHQHSEGNPHSQLDYRGGMSSHFMEGYPSNMHSSASSTLYHQEPADRSFDRYSHNQFAATAGPEHPYSGSGRESFDAPNHAESSATLDTGVLNRSFIPPFTNNQHPSVIEQSTPHYKDPPYPSPHQTSPMG